MSLVCGRKCRQSSGIFQHCAKSQNCSQLQVVYSYKEGKENLISWLNMYCRKRKEEKKRVERNNHWNRHYSEGTITAQQETILRTFGDGLCSHSEPACILSYFSQTFILAVSDWWMALCPAIWFSAGNLSVGSPDKTWEEGSSRSKLIHWCISFIKIIHYSNYSWKIVWNQHLEIAVTFIKVNFTEVVLQQTAANNFTIVFSVL